MAAVIAQIKFAVVLAEHCQRETALFSVTDLLDLAKVVGPWIEGRRAGAGVFDVLPLEIKFDVRNLPPEKPVDEPDKWQRVGEVADEVMGEVSDKLVREASLDPEDDPDFDEVHEDSLRHDPELQECGWSGGLNQPIPPGLLRGDQETVLQDPAPTSEWYRNFYKRFKDIELREAESEEPTDWTLDGLDLSPEFVTARNDVDRIIQESSQLLICGLSSTVAGLIVARLAYNHGLAPSGKRQDGEAP